MEPTLELLIEKLSSDGSGIARVSEGSLREGSSGERDRGERPSVVFVEGALPGEVVEAEITKRKKDFSLARVVRVKRANPRRVSPVCPVFGVCGGCQLQYASYDLQLEIKADIVRDALTRIGGFLGVGGGAGELPEIECVASPEQWGYRNKASFPVHKVKGKPTAGFYAAGSHRLVPLTSCPVNAAPLNGLFGAIQKALPALELDVYDERGHEGALRHLILRAGRRTGQTLASLVVNGRLNARNMKSISGLRRSLKDLTTLTLNHNSRPGNVILGPRTETITGGGLIEERLDGWTLAYDTSSFFQVNTEQAVQLYRHVRDLSLGNRVLELYSGVGSLTLYLSHLGAVTAVEEWSAAAALMKSNLEKNGVTNVRVLEGKAEDAVADIGTGYDLVVLDPPRTGCERAVLDKILELGPARVVYVSCNPATLARDAKILRQGDYRLTSVRAFDMFPQTVHVETVALLTR
ncbi:MAG: 23S rRNA (uracil(1939)-C(5))-methyltransferase RlmD [Synergistaceae bacterium]|jgi:23S rRNA (uracil1939-C5)-methyltransferase|nr:23S rRNA (uracil(1939)-C(5))-methyltransferase RlmD [Synergistaceae bacterium]